ncbi:MAG: TetR/AcrR family transcriptional regulator [Gemmiger sp.]
MDKRKQKTLHAIREAFFTLRGQKPLERIRVQELADLAQISKATFYLHYRDVYDLSEQLQREVVRQVLAHISHPDAILDRTQLFTAELFSASKAYQKEISVLFADSQESALPRYIEQALWASLCQTHPEVEDNPLYRLLLTYEIHGSLRTYQEHRAALGDDAVVKQISAFSEALCRIGTP